MLVKAKSKDYGNGNIQHTIYNVPYPKGPSKAPERKGIGRTRTEEEKAEDLYNSRKSNAFKCRTKIKDLVLMNDFTHFWTFTFATERKDDKRCIARIRNWLKYQKGKHGNFKHIIVPERHKTGEIHFHAVTSGYEGELADSGVKHKGRTVYNATEWSHGFTTVSKIQSTGGTANYISKYIIKDWENPAFGKGKKKYWASRNLERPAITYSDEIPADIVQCKQVFGNENIALFESND